MESKKRKLPARASARVEAVSKKRTATPEQLPPTPPAPPPPVEEPLPHSVIAGRPLPVVDKPQPPSLPTTQYKSVSESGVMAESLERSRKKWLNEGIFEKFWTKPVKKKGFLIEEPGNPTKDMMTKLGNCTITVEPHVFDVIMYAVKDMTPKPAPPPPQQSMYRPIIQYGPPNGIIGQPHLQPPHPSTPQHQQMPPPQSLPTHVQANNSPAPPAAPAVPNGTPTVNGQSFPPQNPAPAAAQAPLPPTPPTALPPSPAPQSSSSVPPAPQPAPQSAPQPAPQPSQSSQPAPQPAQPGQPAKMKSTDPVIQMLAERAVTDPELTSLMRIVADGRATTDQLKRFQAHIDELTKLLHTRHAASQASQNQGPPPPSTPRAQPHPAPDHQVRPMQPSQVPNGQYLPPPPPQAQSLRSKGPPLSSKPDISAVVFEFVGGSGDRFLFPKYSILEYLPGGQIIASFLIVRKGSSAESKSYDPALDYYQPVTIRLFTHQPRQLDSLAKVVAPPDEVRKYMDDIMDNMTRAEYVLLAMRLPRETEQAPPEQRRDEAMPDAPPGDQVLWTASANPMISKHKALKKPLSEEEQYQHFISTVS